MAASLLLVYGSTQFLTANDAAQVSAVPVRDGTGNINAVGYTAGTLGLVNLTGPVFNHAVATKTTTYNITATDYIIPVDPTGGAFAVNLPVVAANTGRALVIVNVSTNTSNITITGSGAETINGANTLVVGASRFCRRLWCDGTAWYVIGN